MWNLRGRLAVALGVAAVLAGCGGSSSSTSVMASSTARGTLVENPPLRIASVDASTFQAQLSASSSGQQLLQLSGNPVCGVDFYYVKFWTVGGPGEQTATESSGAVMVPTGSAASCSGARPVVLYAHGTNTDKTLNLADPTNPNNTEGALVAAMFAAQGYIVVAPNYAGYDISTLGYHPYINASQNADEMMDILAAATTAMPMSLTPGTSIDATKLFVTGYSEGGYVAMAATRALEAAGKTVTASAPMSGPYAMVAFGDALMTGHVDIGSTVFTPLLTTSYQNAYKNIYSVTTDFYTATYAHDIDTLLPSATPIDTIIANGLLPESAAFNSTTPVVSPAMVGGNAQFAAIATAELAIPTSANPLDAAVWSAGFGTPYLINDSVRINYVLDLLNDPDGTELPTPTVQLPAVSPTYGLRADFYVNDMRNPTWVPSAPILMCGGENDPTVFFTNTQIMQEFWGGLSLPAGLVNVLDVDPSTTPSGPFAQIQVAFQTAAAQQIAYLESPAGGGLTLQQAEEQLIPSYHTSVAPFCTLAARSFFSQF